MATMRIPIIQLYGNLVVPIQGSVDDATMTLLHNDVMHRIEACGARGLVIDVSGIELMDSYLTRNIRDLALTARLMGLRSVVSGLMPEVAITVIEMGLEIPGVETALNVERALDLLSRCEEDAPLGAGEHAGG
jgi:rsbT antagonist protein RsbS